MHLVTFSLVTILILHVDLRDEGKKQELLNDVSLTDSFAIDCPGSNLSLENIPASGYNFTTFLLC